MNQSKEIFKLDKEILVFRINNSNLNKLSSYSSIHSGQLQAMSEENIKVSNLTSNYIAFRTRTTKKDIYAVNPTYCIIEPNKTTNLNFIFYSKPGLKLDPKQHKFMLEGFIIQESEKDEDPKNLFKNYIQKGEVVTGNIQKRRVQFVEENEEGSNLKSSKNPLAESTSSNYTVPEGNKQEPMLMDTIKEKEIEKEDEKEGNIRLSDIIQDKGSNPNEMEMNRRKLESLKEEYNQLK